MINFNKKSVGLDIADHTIEVVELEKIGRKIKISSLGRIILEPGVVERGRIKNEEKLAQAVKNVLAQAKPIAIKTSSVIFGLPESQTYIHVFNITASDKKNIEAVVLSEAQSIIPLKEQDLLYAYRVFDNIKSIKESVKILLVATSSQVILEWQQFFEKINLAVELFDIEALAAFRGLFNKLPEEPIGLLDLGAATTSLSIFTSAGLRYSYSINCAGQDFTKQIAQELKIDFKEAEKLKINKGLGENQNQAVNTILNKSLQKIIDGIKINIDYWQKNNSQEVQEIILLGGSSQMLGLVDYLNSMNLSVKVRLAKPLFRHLDFGFEYIEAIGLAIRGIEKKWLRTDPFIPTSEDDTGKIKSDFAFNKINILKNILNWLKSRNKKMIFSGLFICLILTCLFFYQIFSQQKQPENNLLKQYPYSYSLTLEHLITIDKEAYTDNKIKGRIIEKTVKEVMDYDKAVAIAQKEVKLELKDNEKLWIEPLNEEQDGKTIIFPLKLRWLVYNQADAKRLFLAKTRRELAEIDFVYQGITFSKLQITDNEREFLLSGKISLLSKQLPSRQDKLDEPEKEKQISKEIVKVKNLNQPLNIRSGPGTNYQVIGKVNSGESYILLEEDEEWFKIKLLEGLEGWIFANFAEKLTN